jgi:dihydroflavonol-4-reductase
MSQMLPVIGGKSSQTVLVTGGNGFVASRCILTLLQQGYTVRTTLRNPEKSKDVLAAIHSGGQSGDRLSFATADLTRDDGWDAAMVGCDYVLHVASPLGRGLPQNPNELIVPARDGALRVLRSALKAGVQRIVMTSAVATARLPHGSERVSDETVWSDPAKRNFDAYRLSKILAERAAWEYMDSQNSRSKLTTILPGAVYGPILGKENMGSVQIIQRLLQGRIPGLMNLAFWVVDVRDVADLHIRAMRSPEAEGERFIAVGELMWMRDIARTLRESLGKRAAKVPTRRLPNGVVRLLALFVPALRFFTSELGRRNDVTAQKAKTILSFSPRPAAETLVDCAESILNTTA